MNGGKWVDPAPFEGVRPRVPWWVLVPGKAKWIAALVALVWLVMVGAVRLVLVVVRYPGSHVGAGFGGLVLVAVRTLATRAGPVVTGRAW